MARGEDAAKPPRSMSTVRWALGLAVVLSVGLDLFFFTGYYASDDIGYAAAAESILQTGRLPDRIALSMNRLTVVGWNTFVGATVSRNVQVIAASYVLHHQILILLTFLLGRRLFNWKVGLIAAYCIATLPMLITSSTCILPDVILGNCFVLTLYAFVRGLDARDDPSPWRARRWLLLAGIVVGLGYMAKESALVALPFYLVFWLIRDFRRPSMAAVSRGAMFAVGFFVMLGAETAALSYLAGRTYVRLAWTADDLDPGDRAHIGRYGVDPIGRMQWVDTRLNSDRVQVGLKMLMIASIVLFPFVCRRRWVVYAFALWLFIYLTFGTMRWTEYLPPSIKARYYIPTAPFFFVIYAAVIVALLDRLQRRLAISHWRRPILWVVIAFLIVYPLTGLGGPNRLAGRIYRADIVDGTGQALRHVASGDGLPTGVSKYLSYRAVHPLQYGTEQSPVIAYPQLGEPRRVASLVRRPRFRFILLNPDQSAYMDKSHSALGPLDWVLRRLVQQGSTDGPSASDGENVWSLGSAPPASAIFEGRELTVRHIDRFQSLPTRTAEVAAALWRQADDAAPEPDRHAKAVLLLEVESRPIAVDGGARLDGREIKPAARQWRLIGAVGNVRTQKLDDGEFCVTTSGGDGEAIWLVPQHEGHGWLDGASGEARLDLTLDVKMPAAMKVALAMRPRGDTEPVAGPYHAMRPGANHMRLSRDEVLPRRVLAIELTGSGRFFLRRLVVSEIEQYRGWLESLDDWYIMGRRDKRSKCKVSREGKGGARIQFKLDDGEYAWFSPSRSFNRAGIELAPNRRFDFLVRAHVSQGTTLRLRLDMFADPQRKTRIDRRRLVLRSGQCRFSILTDDERAYLWPTFKLLGSGEVEIREFSSGMRRLPATHRRVGASLP